MAELTEPLVGANLNKVDKAVDVAGRTPFVIGTTALGDDGKLYVYAKANATIAANTAVCTVNNTTFLATATAGTYMSPSDPVGMVSGDYGWFGKVLV